MAPPSALPSMPASAPVRKFSGHRMAHWMPAARSQLSASHSTAMTAVGARLDLRVSSIVLQNPGFFFGCGRAAAFKVSSMFLPLFPFFRKKFGFRLHFIPL